MSVIRGSDSGPSEPRDETEGPASAHRSYAAAEIESGCSRDADLQISVPQRVVRSPRSLSRSHPGLDILKRNAPRTPNTSGDRFPAGGESSVDRSDWGAILPDSAPQASRAVDAGPGGARHWGRFRRGSAHGSDSLFAVVARGAARATVSNRWNGVGLSFGSLYGGIWLTGALRANAVQDAVRNLFAAC